MKDLFIEKQGVRGGKVTMDKVGEFTAFNDNERLLHIDNYRGFGQSYKQMDEPIIIIYDGKNSPNEEVIFEGTFESLIDLLIKNK
jgi:hypothetical protein